MQSPKLGLSPTTSYLNSQYPDTKVFTKPKRTRKGGRVIIYVENTLTAVKIEKKLDAENYDTIYVDITSERNRKLTFGTVYRPPKLQAADDTALYEEINSTQNKKAIIIGDFNCPNVDWNLMH